MRSVGAWVVPTPLEAAGTCRRNRMSCCSGSVTSQTLTFIAAVTRPSDVQKAMNSPFSGLPRQTTVSAGPPRPEYSMPRSFWSV